MNRSIGNQEFLANGLRLMPKLHINKQFASKARLIRVLLIWQAEFKRRLAP